MNAIALAVHRAAIEQRPSDLDKLPPAWTISAGYERSTEDSATIVHHPAATQGGPADKGDVALGVPIVRKGQRAITMTVTASVLHGEGDVLVGVCDANAAFSDSKAGRAWGVRLKTGDCYSTSNAYYAGSRGRTLYAESKLRTPQVGPVTCTVLIDMVHMALAFQIGDKPPVDAGVDLADVVALRPWALMVDRRQADAIQIGSVSVQSLKALKPP